MSLHLTPTTTRISKRLWDRRALAAGATVLGLTLVVGAATWQTAGRHEQANTGGVLSRPATTTVSQERAGSLSATQAGGGQMLYIVRSQEQGEWVRRFSYELGQVSGHPVSVGVVMLTETADVAALDALPRAPGTRTFDLR